MQQHDRHDLLLALISIFSVLFVVLFISLAYFLNFRSNLERREAYVNALLEEMRMVDSQRDVAGYQVSE